MIGIIICDPSMYTMDHSDLTVSKSILIYTCKWLTHTHHGLSYALAKILILQRQKHRFRTGDSSQQQEGGA